MFIEVNLRNCELLNIFLNKFTIYNPFLLNSLFESDSLNCIRKL
jgi:hypothetical protein